MLYSENRKSGKKGICSLIVILTLTILSGCKLGLKDIEASSDMEAPVFVFDPQAVRQSLADLAAQEKSKAECDKQTKQFYQNEDQGLVWMSGKDGIGDQADILVKWLKEAEKEGLSAEVFGTKEIERDLDWLRTRQFDSIPSGSDSIVEDINHVAARLDYHLTKACMRYVTGQRYGYMNPHRAFNFMDPQKQDASGRIIRYRSLFDLEIERPDSTFFAGLLHQITAGDIDEPLKDCQPKDAYYQQLKRMLASATGEDSVKRIICNMERCRWRYVKPIQENEKRVVVNIPAFHLYAYGGDTLLHMKVVCGATLTKTPLLASEIEWMEVNPQWVIPMSILEKDVARHAGDSAYFARNRYNIFDKATNQQMNVEEVSRAMLLSGNYRVAQESGTHNSLGRIVFRFKNNHSVFLHYTSNPGAFARERRAISHGCVRVHRPYELASFVLDNPDEWLLERIAISMGMKAQTERGRKAIASYRAANGDNEDIKLVGYVPVKPRVPIYIIYYTLWPDEQGVLQEWPDVYGYDNVIWKHLKPFVKYEQDQRATADATVG